MSLEEGLMLSSGSKVVFEERAGKDLWYSRLGETLEISGPVLLNLQICICPF
jgi:hypothetical protein